MEQIVMIVLWLLSYFLSKKKGASDGKAALIATGVTAGAYYTGATGYVAKGINGVISNGSTSTASPSTASTAGGTATIAPSTSALGTVGAVASTALTSAGGVLSSWGPTGTAGVIATTAAVSGKRDSKWLWFGAAAGVLLLMKG